MRKNNGVMFPAGEMVASSDSMSVSRQQNILMGLIAHYWVRLVI